MSHSTRRNFLKQTTGLLGVAFVGTAFNFPKTNTPLLSFSTLGCPDWDFQRIVNFAAESNYNGIEVRGIKRELNLPNCPEFSSPKKILASRKVVEDKGLKFVGLGSSAALHYGDLTKRNKNLSEAKRFIDLAQQLNCPYVRVFPNDFPKEVDKKQVIDLISKGLLELGDYAKGSKVKVLLESHGAVVHSDDLSVIMKAAKHPNVGMIWDIVNMWAKTKESPVKVYEVLKDYIDHTHIKDMKIVDGKIKYTFLGKGETPVFEAINILAKSGYKGYYSFEWEKMWHPELEAPEIALLDYSKVMNDHFKNI
ncbi:MAG: sugar phosphate isomerase/epimerase family protein [Pedobacter sp.]|uniref:sugar phosphate isomerase/epimerase family protein n=1 Tax=Pedobacter sp. TaxID=1411316 RepID=UPI003563AF3F